MAVMLSRAVDALGMKIVKTHLKRKLDGRIGIWIQRTENLHIPVLRLFIRTEKSGNIRCCARYGNYPDRRNDKAVFADILSESTEKKVYEPLRVLQKDADKTTVEFIENETGEIMNLECRRIYGNG